MALQRVVVPFPKEELAWDEDVHTTAVVRCLSGVLWEVCLWEWAPTDGDVTVCHKILHLLLQNFSWSFAITINRSQKHLALGQNAEIIILLLAVLLYF